MDLETLVAIDRLRLQFTQPNNLQVLQEALETIAAKTLNAEWYREALERLATLGVPVEETTWVLGAMDKYNAQAWANRDLFHKASESLDPARIADASIVEGLWHINGGEFRAAKHAFETARRAYPPRAVECIYYSTSIDLLRHEYSATATAIGKHYQVLQKSNEPLTEELLYSYALSLWKSGLLASAAVVLLDLADFGIERSRWPWASRQELATICIVGSLLALENENIHFLVHSDIKVSPIFNEWPFLRDLVLAFLEVDIAGFDLHWAKASSAIDLFLVKELETARTQLRNSLLQTYLAVRSRCPLDTVLGLFRVPDALHLAAEARKHNFPIKINPMEGVVTVQMPASHARPEFQYVADAVLTIWHSIEADNRPPIDSNSGIQGLRQRERYRFSDWSSSGAATPPPFGASNRLARTRQGSRPGARTRAGQRVGTRTGSRTKPGSRD